MAKIASFLTAALLTLLLAADTGTAETGGSTATGVRVTDITTSSRDDGVSVLEIITDRQLEPGMFFYFRIAGAAPREVISLRNVLRPYRQRQLQVGDRNIDRVRIGYHSETTPPELHIVLDLVSDEVSVQRVTADGTRLVMELATSAVTESPIAATEPTGDERAAVAAGDTGAAVAAGDAGAAVAAGDDQPVEQTVVDGAADQPAADNDQPADSAGGAEEMTVAESGVGEGAGSSLPTITAVDTTVQVDGSTVVTVRATASFAANSVRGLYFAGVPPRYALSFLGARLSGVPGRLTVSDPNLQEIELYSYTDRQPPEVQLMLMLASVSVQVGEVSREGQTLTLRLTKP